MNAASPPPVPSRFPVAALPFDVRPGEVGRNLEAALAGLEAAASAGARLLLLPEKWTTSFLPGYRPALLEENDRALAALHERAAELGVTVIGSAPGGGGGERPWNELHVLGAAGDQRPYRKRILFSPTNEEEQCRAGEELLRVFQTPVGKVAAVICYDLRFPELTRPAFYGGADLLVVPAQWPRPRNPVLELLTRARAAENQCWALSCNRAGRASLGSLEMEFPGTATLADPTGRETARSEAGRLLLGEVDRDLLRRIRETVPCARDLERSGVGKKLR
ncbi:MAG: carbon-nitrogen hydrolase family protein [Planctomycetota bacterium]